MSHLHLTCESSARLPTQHGTFRMHVFKEAGNGKEHIALVMGRPDSPALLRVHSECMTGDVFGSTRCDCGPQLDKAMHQISQRGSGVLIYLRQEGRGIGLINKLKAYALQDTGCDTVEANFLLGYPPDLRRFDVAASILKLLGVEEVEIMTNNPEKIAQLEKEGILILSRHPSQVEVHPENARYLATKVVKLNHQMDWLLA